MERHEHHICDVRHVQSLVTDQTTRATFSAADPNVGKLIELFDEVFVLDIDADTLQRRLEPSLERHLERAAPPTGRARRSGAPSR